jgi:hypothetical protein
MARYTFKILKLTLASLTSFLIFPSQSWAVPGQLISEAVRWSANHPLISKLMFQEKYEDEADYVAEGETTDAKFSLNIWLDKANRINTENIDYRPKAKSTPLNFERSNYNGVFFLEQMYGKAIAEDFKSARYVRRVKDNLQWDNHFYLGKQFAYSCMNNAGEGIFHFTLIKRENMNTYIQSMIDYREKVGE